MDDRFFGAFLPPQAIVCGRRLRKFTLWHHFILSALDNPVAVGGESISVPQVLVAVRACRLKYGESSMSPGVLDVLWKFRMLKRRTVFKREAKKLYQWVSDHCRAPLYWRESNGGKRSAHSGPQCLALVASLMQRGGMSREESWNTSLGEALWMDAEFARLEGVPLHFVDEADVSDEPLTFDDMSEDEVLAVFKKDLPEKLAIASFNADASCDCSENKSRDGPSTVRPHAIDASWRTRLRFTRNSSPTACTDPSTT